VIAALDEGLELDAVAALAFDLDADVAGSVARDGDVTGSGLDGENRVREAAVGLPNVALVLEVVRLEFGLDLAGSFPDRAVDAAGVAVLAPAAAAGRAAAGDLHFGRVGERGDFVADVVGGQPGRGLGLLHRVFPVGNVMAVRDAGEGLGLFGTRYLYELGSGRQRAEEVDQLVLVGGQLVHVVRRDDRRLLVVDQSPELAVGDDVSSDLLPIVDRQCVRWCIAAHVTALDIDAEDDRIECTRSRTHRRS